MVMNYREEGRNQLANCMLLSREENGASGNGDTLPEEWFADKDQACLIMHLIPVDPVLWKMDRLEDFIEERRKIIRERLQSLLVLAATTAAP
jgi:hypothetical protein